MSEGRDYLLRVWQLAEELAVRSRKPLHAFLLLHHVLTRPPPQLRNAGTSLKARMTATTAPATASSEAPLHLPSLDAEWKCEELATRVRAAEYLLFPDSVACGTTEQVFSAPRTLSRAAALESLELVEQVLAPVFATASHTSTAAHLNGERAAASLDAVFNEVAQAGSSGSSSANANHLTASSLPPPAASSFLRSDTRTTSMYFLNESTVTALAWPLTAFTLTWPCRATPPANVSAASGGSSSSSNRGGDCPSSASLPLLHFKAANQTIMIAVALVVRAHVLQANVCYRRAQYKRALECLAEGRKWVERQFDDPAQARSLRLLWADLLERWSSLTAPSRDALETHLPRFEPILKQLMELERRACEAMLSVEECRVHFMILQTCGSLPAPPLLVVLRPPLEQPLSDSSPSVHAPDLRLHYRRYQDSVQRLHQVSRVYMRVLEWIDQEAGGNGSPNTEGGRRIRVKTEGVSSSEVKEEEEEEGECGPTSESRAHVRLVQRQLSPFCFSALHVATPPFSDFAKAGESSREVKPEPTASRATSSRAQHSIGAVWIANYDKRLAAAVLGWYHCVSFFYVLYQPSVNTAMPASNSSSGGGGTVERRARQADESEEAGFLARYACVSASSSLRASFKTPSPTVPGTSTGAAASLTSALPSDAVQRALSHFRVYAHVFGAFPTALHNSDESCNSPVRWRCDAADVSASTPSLTPPPAHEAALLLCLAEAALTDNYPFILHFGNELKEGAAAYAAQKHALVHNATTPAAAVDEEAKHIMKSEGESRAAPSHSLGANAVFKRSRTSLDLVAPPPSWHWVLPGVRTTLQLYLELTTVLMQAASTMPTGTPPSSPALVKSTPSATTAHVNMRAGAPASLPSTSSSPQAPPLPILQTGLQRAEQLLARLLFALDREMLQLTGNTWGAAAPPSTAQGIVQGQHKRHNPSAVQHNGEDDTSLTASTAGCLSSIVAVDHLQSSPPAQLRWLVQIKAASLLTMARHHLTQLSIVRAVHHLREAQQFARIFHRQAKVSLLPEMHVLLAAVAACMALRRLPNLPQRGAHEHIRLENGAVRRGDTADFGEGEQDDGNERGDAPSRHPRHEHEDVSALREALFNFAQGWPSIDATSSPSSAASAAASLPDAMLRAPSTSGEGGGRGGFSGETLSATVFSISPKEEATIAQDVGLPYLHLLAAERAACTSLCTSPSFFLLLRLMRAWAVYQLVVAGEEVSWVAEIIPAEAADATPTHERPPRSQPQHHQTTTPSASPLSPGCPPLPLPVVSYATTTLNSTVEDQQRRVARLDSLTLTPTSTPTLRSRHATLPVEMQRIQLDQQAPSMSPATAPATAADAALEQPPAPLLSTTVPKPHASDAGSGPARESVVTAPQPQATSAPSPTTAAALAAANARLSPPVPPLPPSLYTPSSITLGERPQQRRPPPTAQVTPVPSTIRHRAGDVLQRMMAVLRHHYEAYAMSIASPPQTPNPASTTAAASIQVTAWTPQNIVLFRLLRGATLLTEDRDEPAAARELKETTHYAKQHLGVLHPYVADGLALLTSAYTSLDLDMAPSGGGSSSPSSPPQDGASRTRRVAVQLAMRCSCTALAALAASDNASSPFAKPPSGSAALQGREGETSSSLGAATTTVMGERKSDTTSSECLAGVPSQQHTMMHARLRDWWSSQVLGALCGNGSGHRSLHAMKQLHALFDWLPGTADG
jgi:hypothetical protein